MTKSFFRIAGTVALACTVLSAIPSGADSAEPALHVDVAPMYGRIGWLGEKPTHPAPTVIFLGSSVETSMTDPQYRAATELLRRAGILCVTIDVPGEGGDKREGEPSSLKAWAFRLDRGENVVQAFVRRASGILDYLVEQRVTDPTRVAVFGTSRGGFLAFHLSAADSRVSHVGAFSPVTDLFALSEFSQMSNEIQARSLNANRIAGSLSQRQLWIVIGSTDFRVSTQSTIGFFQRVLEEALARMSVPTIELHIRAADGHRVPAGSYEQGAEWLLQQWRL